MSRRGTYHLSRGCGEVGGRRAFREIICIGFYGCRNLVGGIHKSHEGYHWFTFDKAYSRLFRTMREALADFVRWREEKDQ